MTLYAARLVLMFELSLYLFAKQKAKQKRKRKQKKQKSLVSSWDPLALGACRCAHSDPATLAHHSARGGTRHRRRPPPRSCPHTCTPTAHALPCAPIRSPTISASRRQASSARLITAHHSRRLLCPSRRYAQGEKMGRASIFAKLI